MKKAFRYFAMMLAASGIVMTSCLDKEEIVNNQKEQYQNNWVEVFGDIDPDHDWSVAKQVNATFNLTGVVSGEHTARIYTEQPGHKRCKLLAEVTLNGKGNVSFNIEKVSEEVFIKVTDANGKTAFDGYFTIEGNQLTADSRTIASRGLARDASSGTSLGSIQPKSLGTVYRSGTNEYNEFYNVGQDDGEQAVALGDIYVFDGSQATNRVTYNFKDSIYPIVSRNGGVFAESQDNRHKMTQGVEYVTSQAGKVSLTYVYGATALYNAFGYYYWEDGKSASDAKRIVLINDARPHTILRTASSRETTWDNATTLGHSMKIDNDIRESESNVPNYIIGSKYDLVYYGPNYDQAGTYEFPANVHIGFFIYTTYWKKVTTTDDNGQTIGEGMAFGAPNDEVSPLTSSNNDYLKTLMYSIPDHNKAILEYQNYRTSIEKNQGSNTGNSQLGEVSAVTYQYQGRKYLGFEDGVDKDMNDLIFLVEANIEVEGADNAFVDRDEDYIPEVETNSWIIACEDLGSVGDYDFNDAVFSVSHVGGSNTLTVTPLAAGGTYPIEVLYNDLNIGGSEGTDFHKLIDSEASVSNELYSPINAYTRGTAGEPITIEGVPADYDINNHGFTVKVTKNPNEGSVTITAPDHKKVKAPQMLVLPGNWIWPVESKNIHSGYPQFGNWTNNQDENKEWYKNPVQEDGWLVDKPSTDEDEPGQGGSDSGSGSGSATPIVKTLPVYNGDSKIGDINVEGGEWNYYIQIPAGYITNNGATITFTGANESGNNIQIKLDGQVKAETNTNVMTISNASQLSGKAVDLYFWMNADSFNKITGIVINNTGNGSGNEEPETPTLYWEYWTCYNESSDIYGIPLSKLEELSGSNGVKITVTLENGQTDQVGLFHNINNVGGSVLINRNDQSANVITINVTKDNINSWKNSGYNTIYTGLSNTGNTIANISIEAVNSSSTPTTVTLQITGGETSTLTLEGTEGNYYVTIPAGTFGNYGATIEFTSSDPNSQIQNVTVGGQNGYTTVTNNNGYLKIEVKNTMVNSSTATEIRIPNTVTSIVITNNNGITFTVDDVQQSNLTWTTGDGNPYLTIPKTALTGNNGATITITSNADLGGQLSSGSVTVAINSNKTIELTADNISNLSESIYIYVWNGYQSITAISITNNNTTQGGGESGGGETTTTDWMSYRSTDYKTATIPKSDLPIGNNGISISLNISKETNIIVGQAIKIWDNGIQGYGTSFTKTISQAEINKISGDNIVIWLNDADATITNIEITAAN